MFVFEILFLTLAKLVSAVCAILFWLIIGRIVVSWLPVDPYHSIVLFLIQVTDPILAPFRRLPLRIGMLDLTPLVAIFAIQFVNSVLSGILIGIAQRL